MKLKNLITKGYFSEELPPPFSTLLLGEKLSKVQLIISNLSDSEMKKINETNFVKYSISKVGIHRRLHGIPNPFHQIKLSEAIYKYWANIKMHYNKSNLSASIPEVDKSSKRAIIQFEKYGQFKEKCIKASFDASFELKSDISNYFPSIYTHSIPWAIHSKSEEKKRRNSKVLY